MAEPTGLGDLRDVVFDHPGFVGVAEVVEVHSLDDRPGVFVGVAVDGGSEDASGHVGAAEVGAAGAAEDMVVAVEDFLEEGDEEGWEVDVAGGVGGFGWAEVEAALDFVEGADLE